MAVPQIKKSYKIFRENVPTADPVAKEWDENNFNDTEYKIELIE